MPFSHRGPSATSPRLVHFAPSMREAAASEGQEPIQMKKTCIITPNVIKAYMPGIKTPLSTLRLCRG